MSSLPDTLVQFRSDLEDAIGFEQAAGRRNRRQRRRRVVVLAAVALVAVGTASAFAVRAIVFGSAPSSFAPAWSPDGRKIAYVHTGGGDPRVDLGRLYVMNADGSAPRRLGPAGCCPSWSPDGSKLAFVGGLGQVGSDIYVINRDGSRQRNLTHTPAWEDSPVWSPDGRRLAIVKWTGCLRCSPNSELWVMNVDGSGRRLSAAGVRIGVATWSPDGRTLVYQSSYRPSPKKHKYMYVTELFRVNADGSGRRRLAYGERARWSPDGEKIAFIARRGRNADLWVMNPDGSGQRRLTHTPGGEGDFAWSPDGKKIAFMSGRHSGISVINADGSGMRTLTRDLLDAGVSSWSPDGRKILFTSFRNGATDIYVMNADGSGMRNLTHSHEG